MSGLLFLNAAGKPIQQGKTPESPFHRDAGIIPALCLPGSPEFCDPMPLISDLLHRLTPRVSLHTSKPAIPVGLAESH
ncbi:hypothetical protein SAMN05216570_1565 [Dyella sp. OK004]|nr:hypothetical protein SAMN05216570_1565 [Dyella sp. OK004]